MFVASVYGKQFIMKAEFNLVDDAFRWALKRYRKNGGHCFIIFNEHGNVHYQLGETNELDQRWGF